MSTNLREQLSHAVANVQKFSDDLDAKNTAPSGEDLANLKSRLEEVRDLKAAVLADGERRQEMAEAKKYLAGLAGDEPEVKSVKVLTESQWGAPTHTAGKTLGELFTGSDAYGDFVGRYAKNGIIPNAVKGVQSNPFNIDQKALITGLSDASGGAFITTDRQGNVTDLIGERELTIVDLVTQGSTTSDTVDYVRVTGKTNNAATVAEATSAAGPTAPGTAGALVPVAGGGYKPESALAFDVVTATVKTIANWIPITKRAASDAAQVRTMVDSFLRYNLNEELEDQVLTGNGAGENFTGILQSGPLTVGSAGTDIDAVVDAIAAVRTQGRRRPTGLVVHPNDWYSTGFLTAKDTTGNYLVGNPRASIDQLNTLWGLNVVVSEAIPENTLLVGDFRQAVLWSREGVSLMVSDQHSDFFVRNLLAILAEMRAAFGVLDPQAFCTVSAV
jgi:HK97 family phage major capsid protein